MQPEETLCPSSATEAYERWAVPAVFEPYAHDIIERARPIGPSDRILDLGCGTGIVARILRQRLGGGATIVGVDVSRRMIEKARAVAPEIDFREGNAVALPFADGSFDVVLCQAMLQFVPDRRAALREVRRVLASSGRFLVSTWRPSTEQPLHEAQLRRALEEAGFADICIETVSLVERLRNFSGEVFACFGLDEGFGAATAANVATATAPPRAREVAEGRAAREDLPAYQRRRT
jgi:SAM-dependent methyltransferase